MNHITLEKRIKDTLLIEVPEIIDVIAESCEPDEVFDKETLEEWAENNGFAKEDKAEKTDE